MNSRNQDPNNYLKDMPDYYDDDSGPPTKADFRRLEAKIDRIFLTLHGQDSLGGVVGEMNDLKIQLRDLKLQAKLVRWFAAGITLMGITAMSSSAARWVDKVNKAFE